jgi:hypothetical protein
VRPLRESTDSLDPNVAAAQSLLSRVLPLEPDTDRQRRVRLRLDAAPRSSFLPVLRPALVACVLLGVTAAGAKMGGVLPRSASIERFFSRPVQTLEAPVTHARTQARALVAKRAQAAAAADEPSLDAPLEAQIDAAQARKSRHAGPAPSAPGAKLMMEAMQARRSGDTARAAQLLKEYQRKYPDGALQEEALALSMEAAAARGDASAGKLARRYLERYPNGRFRDQAQRVLRSGQR